MPFGDFFDKLMQEVGLSDPPPPPPQQGPIYGPAMPAPGNQLDQLIGIINQNRGSGPVVPPLNPTPMPSFGPGYYNPQAVSQAAGSKPITQPTPDLIRHWQQQQQAQQIALLQQQQQQAKRGGGLLGLTVPPIPGIVSQVLDQSPDLGGLTGAAGDLYGGVKDAAGAVLDNPVQAAFQALGVLDRPRQEVVEDMGNQAYYQATHNGAKPNHGLSANPYVLLGNILPDSFLTRWANNPQNWEAVKKAYEQGYDSDGDGKVDFTGGRAVWELYAANLGTVTKMAADLAFDPLSAAAGIGAGAGAIGKGAEAAGKAEDASRAARIAGEVIGPLGKGTETVLHAADAAPGFVILGGGKKVGQGIGLGANFVTGGLAGEAATKLAAPIRYLAQPAARTLAERNNRELGDALNAVSRSETGLWDAAKQTAPAPSTVADTADAAVADAANVAPTSALPDPAFPAPAPHPYGLDQATVDQLGYLAPKAGGDRFVDQVFAGLAQTDPSAQKTLLDRYLPLAQQHISQMDAIELARSRAAKAGKDVSRFAIDKPLASARHVAEDLMPIARDVLGTDTPAYRFMNEEPLGDTFKILRDETGKVLLSKEDLRALTPKMQRLIEDAVFGTDPQLATDARFFLRQYGNKRLTKVADELKRLRELVHGPEGEAVVRRAPVEKGGTYEEVFGALPDEVQAERWMDQQEAKSLREMGKPIPEDLKQRLAQPLPPREPKVPVDVPATPTPKPDPLADIREGLDQPTPPLSGKKPAGANLIPTNPASTDPVGDGLARAVEIGDLSQEQADLLGQTVYFDKNSKRYTGSIVNDAKQLKPVLDQKTGTFVNPIPKQDLTEKRVIDVYVEQLRNGATPQQAKDFAYDALKQSVGRPLQDSSSRLGRALGSALHAYDTMTSAVREHIMYNIFTGPRGIATDQIGDAIQLTSQGDLKLAARTFDPRKWVEQWRAVRNPAQEAAAHLAETSTGQTMDRLGLAVPSGFMPNVGREEVQRSGAMSIPKAIERITGSETAGKVTGYATAPLASRNLRDLRSALERTRRFTTYGEALDTGLVDARTRFFDAVQQQGAAKGVDVTGMIDNLGDEFSPKDVRVLAAQAGFADGDALQLAKGWRTEVNGIAKNALETTNQKLFSYEATKGDEVLKRMFLFHYWITRATPRYAETMIRNPEVAVNFYRATEGMKRAAEGKPKSVQGLMQVLTGPAGYALFMNPTALIGTALMFRDQAFDDGQDRLFDRFLKNSGGFMNPLLESAMVAAGWINDEAADPFASYSTRNTLMGIAQYGVSQGWLGENQLLSDPYENTKRRIMGATSNLAATVGVPFAQPLNPGDQQATQKSMISNDIISRVQQQYGLDPNTPLDEWPTEAQQTLNDAQAAFLEHTSGNPIADAAVSAYASANLESRALGLITPGGMRLRNEDRDARMVAASGPDGDPTQRTFRDQANAGSPLAAALNIADANVQAVGKESPQIGIASPTDAVAQGKIVADTYNAIKYGQPTQVIIGTHMYSAAELAALSEDERGVLADQWLAEQGGGLDRQAYYDARDQTLAQPINQPYAQFLDARNAMSDIGMEQLARQSPAYAGYLDRLPDNTRNNPDALGAAAMSPAAYLATQGERASVYDPVDLGDTFDPTQADPLAVAQAAAEPAPKAQTREQHLASQMQRYQGDVALFNQVLQQYTGNPDASLDGMNPMLRNAVLANLSQAGVSAPSMPQELSMYQRWASLQPTGADTSIAAYYRWTDQVLAGQS